MSAFAIERKRFAAPPRRVVRNDAFARMGRLIVTAMICASVVMIFAVSDMLLAKLGFSYGEVGGSPIEKVHPGTWLALLALIAIGVGRGNPLSILPMFAAYPWMLIFLVYWTLLLVYTVTITKAPFTPLIDTFFLPMLLVVLIGWLREQSRRRLAIALHLVLAADAIIGVYEYASGWRLTPYLISGAEITSDWRSTALFGHPLGNASIIGAYIVALAVGGGRDLPRLLRPAMLLLCLLSMAAFGGRSSLVIAIVLVAFAGALRLIAVLRGGSFDMLTACVAILAAPLVAAAIYYVADSGFFDQFIERFSNDRGSAKARVLILNLYKALSWQALLFGPDQSYLTSLQALEGIEYGIESFWIGFMMTHGIFMSVFFFAALGCFSWQLVKETRSGTITMLAFYFIVASTAVSMSAKTTIFGMFTAMALLMMRREPVALQDRSDGWQHQ